MPFNRHASSIGIHVRRVGLTAALLLAGAAQAAPADCGAWFFHGHTTPEELTALKARAADGSIDAELAYARALYASGDAAQALSWLTDANDQGSADAQYLLGRMYAAGRGVALDLDQAEYFYGKAAAQHDPAASYELARMLLNAEFDDHGGVPRDPADVRKREAEGLALLREAAAGGSADAALMLRRTLPGGKANAP